MLSRTCSLLCSFLLLLFFFPLSAQQNVKVAAPAAIERSGRAATTVRSNSVGIKKATLDASSSSARIEQQQSRLFIFREQPVDVPSLPVSGSYFSINSGMFDTLAPAPDTQFLIPGFYLGSDATTYTLVLKRFEVLASGFSAVTGTENGDVAFSPDKHLLFAGNIREIPGSYVYLAVFRSYCYGYIELPRPQDTVTRRYIIAPVSLDGISPVMTVYDERDPHEKVKEHVLCSTDETEHTIGSTLRRDLPSGKRGTEKLKTTLTLAAGIAIDCDYEYYQDHGSNLSRAANYALTVIGASSAIYYRDVNVRLLVPYLRIWTTTDPYTGTNTNTLLSQFRSYWNSNMNSVQRVLAHLFSGIGGIGGIAYVDVLCYTSYGYGVSGLDNNTTFPASGYVWDVDVTSHELGHNFSSPHTHSCSWAPAIDSCYDAEGGCFPSRVYRVGSIMSYCHLSYGKYLAFHSRVRTLIRSSAEAATCIPAGSITAVNDVAVIAVTEPVAGAMIVTSASFSPTAVFRNNGSANQTTLTVTCIITASNGTQVYSSTQTISSLSSGASSTATFSPVSLAVVDDYSIQVTITLNSDSYTYNNSLVRPFSITSAVSGSVTVTAPNTGATLTAGGIYTLTWTKNTVTNVLIEFSADNGVTWETVHSNNSGTSYVWTVPGIATTQGRIRVSDRYNSATSDASDNTFTITLNNDIQPIEFVVPTAGGTIAAPFVPRVAFRNNGSAEQTNVSVRLRAINVTTNREVYNALSTIASVSAGGVDTVSFAQFATSASTTYMWYAYALLLGDQNISNDSLTRASSVTVVPPAITITSPNGGEQWQAGIIKNITWTNVGFLLSVKAEYSVNNGSSWTTITSSTSNTGSLLWAVPNLPTSQARVRISDASNAAVNDISNAGFTIGALQPPSALVATSGDNQIGLTWLPSGSSGITGYKVYRGTSSQSLSAYTTVSSQATVFTDNDVVNCNSYYYSVSALIDVIESVQATQATTVAGTNATLTLLAPNGGELWQAGLLKTISWNTIGCVPSVVIEYSTNNGVVWTAVTSAVINTGSYSWSVPNTPTTQALVRIKNASALAVSDVGNAPFIIGAIAPPSAVQVTLANVSAVIIWTPSTSAGVTGYAIYRRIGAGTFTLLNTTGAAISTYTDVTTTSNTVYTYAVGTYVNAASSALSNLVEFCYLVPVIQTNGSTTFCTGNSVTLDVGTGYSSYLWSNGATTQTITVSQSGVYQVTVANSSGYSANTQITITVLPRPTVAISANGSTTFCTGGSVVLNAGSGYSSYLWSNGSTAQSIAVAQSGNYTVTVFNASGCSATSTQSVTVLPRPTVAISANGSTTFCTGGSVTLDAGSGYFSYLWSNGSTAQSIAVAQSGNYTVTVFNASGCSATSTQSVTVLPRPAVAISANGSTTFCTGGSVTLDAGSGYFSYLWSNGSTAQSIVVAQSGNYTVTVMNASGCSATSTQSVTVLPRPTVAISANASTTFCTGGSVTLDAGSGYSSYLWSNGSTAQSIVVAQSGNYTVTVFNASGCSATSTQSVTVLPRPTVAISANGSTTFCMGGSVTLDAGSGHSSYLWSNGSTTQSIAVAQSGNYTVTVFNASGCSATSTQSVTVLPRPTVAISANGSTTFCTGGSVTLDAGSGHSSYLWSNGSTMQSISVAQSGNYTVTVFNASGCSAISTQSVTVLPRPTVAISANGSTTFCTGGSVTLDAGSGYLSYLWSNGSTTQSIAVAQSGNYTVTVLNAGGCSATSSQNVTVLPRPTVAISANGSTTFCTGGSVILDAGVGHLSYLWSNGSTTQSIAVAQSGNYTVTVLNAGGCSATSSQSVTVLPRPAVAISANGSTTFCTGGSVVLDAGSGYFSYLWSNGSTAQSIVVAQSGNYTVTVMNASGCSATSTQSVTVLPRPTVAISANGSTTFCTGGSVILDAGSGHLSYLWSNGSTAQSIVVAQSGNYTVTVFNASGCSATSTQSVTVLPRPAVAISANGSTTFCTGGSVVLDAGSGHLSYLWSNGSTAQSIAVAQSGTYTVTVSNASGCSATSTQSVTVLPRPTVAISANGSTTFCTGGSVILDAGSGHFSYLWSNGSTAQSIAVAQSGNYTVTVFNTSGCSATSTQSVTVYDRPMVTINGPTNVCALSAGILYTANGTSASLNWSVTGGTIISGTTGASIVVNWGNGTSGTIALEAVSAQGCAVFISENIAINNAPMPHISANGATVFCEGNSVTLNAGAGYASYLWSNGATTQTLTVAQTGSYGVVVTAAGGCTGTTLAVVTVLPRPVVPVISASGSTTFCEGGSVMLNAGSGYSSYLWSNGSTTQSISVAQSGNYTATVMNASGCSATSTQSVTVWPRPIPVINVSGSTTFCAGGSVTLDAGSGYSSYLWSNGSTMQSITVTNSGTYSVVVTTGHGCSGESLSVPVIVLPAVVISAGADSAICAGNSVELFATGGVTYTWQPSTGLDNPFIANPIASPTQTTTYIVTGTGQGGCSSSDTVIVEVKPLTAFVSIFLQGAYVSGYTMTTGLRDQNLIPLQQPYNNAPFNYNGTEQLDTVPADIVDWVLVEFRSATNASIVVARRAALLRKHGAIVDVDGFSDVSIPSLSAGSYYIVVRHRTHLAVMSAVPVALTSNCSLYYGFRSSQFEAYSTFSEPMISLNTFLYGLIAGDQSSDGIINASDRVGVRNSSGQAGYLNADVIMDGLVNAIDRVTTRNNTFRVTQLP